jgi:hypothetical protein
MTKEALQLALDALTDFDYDKRMKAIESIKEALETKEWVGLTDEEIHLIAWPHGGETMQAIIKHTILQAEKLLKEKNT